MSTSAIDRRSSGTSARVARRRAGTAAGRRGSWTLPMPGRHVIAQDGLIAAAEGNPDYTKEPEPSDPFPVLGRLRMPAGA